MSFWMWLTRHDAAEVTALLDDPGGAERGRARLYEEWDPQPYTPGSIPAPGLRTLEFVNIRRVWDALHVVLTGRPDDDTPPPVGDPAWDVIMGGSRITPDGARSAIGSHDDLLLLMPAEVGAVDGFLRHIDRDDLLGKRHPLLREVGPYSFGATAGPEADPSTGDMVQNGSLARAFDTLRDFYARAAAAGNAVIKDIS